VTDSAAVLESSAAADAVGSGDVVERGVRFARAPRRLAGVLEFLVVGGGTLLLLPICWLCRTLLGLDEGELLMGALAFHAASLINDPHFSVTYLLFYDRVKQRALGEAYPSRQRLRYWIAGVVVPLALVVWAAVAIANHSARSLGFMIQLMFVLVGWHYVKQGFGVLSVLSRRRGFRWSASTRRCILLHCLAGWAYAWASPFDPGTKSVVSGVFYVTLPHPPGLERATQVLFFASAALAAGAVAREWRAQKRVPPLAALAGLFISVWLWTVYTRLDPLLAFWIPALHSLQYLYFVGLLRRNAARAAAGPPTFKGDVGRTLGVLAASAVGLGWLLLRGLPAWLDAALVLPAPSDRAIAAVGPTPYLAAFTAVVNIHHYFMDSVLWRREHDEIRHLFSMDEGPVEAAG
jgi:hypothetical protein